MDKSKQARVYGKRAFFNKTEPDKLYIDSRYVKLCNKQLVCAEPVYLVIYLFIFFPTYFHITLIVEELAN